MYSDGIVVHLCIICQDDKKYNMRQLPKRVLVYYFSMSLGRAGGMYKETLELSTNVNQCLKKSLLYKTCAV